MLRRANKNKFCGGKFKFDNMAVRRFAFFLLTLSIMLREVANEMVAAGIVPPICGILSHKNCWHAHHRLLKLLAIFPPQRNVQRRWLWHRAAAVTVGTTFIKCAGIKNV